MFSFSGDDSSDGQQKKVFVLAGILAETRDWFDAENKWESRVRSLGLNYFRTTECFSLQGEFIKLVKMHGPDEARRLANNLHDELKEILKRPTFQICCLYGIFDDYRAARLSVEDWETPIELIPYIYAHHELVYRVSIEAAKAGQCIAFLFDCHNKAKLIGDSLEEFKRLRPEASEGIGTFTTGDDKKIPALQMADCVAHTARRLFEDKRDVENETENVADFKAVFPNVRWLAKWKRSYLREMFEAMQAADLRQKKHEEQRGIPEVRQDNGAATEGAPQRDQGKDGSGESS